jgi:hypothetical protein
LGVPFQRFGGKKSWGYVSILLGVTLIRTLNKVPNKAKQKRIKAGGNHLFDLKNEMNRLRDEIARVLKFQISAHFSLVDECNEFERMRNVINLSESFEFTNVKQWSDLVKIAQDSRVSREVQNELNESFRRDLNEKIEKITKNIHYMEYQIDWLDRGISNDSNSKYSTIANEILNQAGDIC